MKQEKKHIITAIDIGTSKVTTLIAEVNMSGGFNITGVGVAPSEGVKKGHVVDLDLTTQSIFQSVNAAEKMANHVVVSAVLGVTGNHVSANSSHGSTSIADPVRGVTRDDMRRAVEASRKLLLPPDKQIVDIIEQEYTVDGQGGIRDPEGMSGTTLEVEVQIITGSSAFIRNLSRCVNKLNIDITTMVPAPMASGEAVLNEDEKEIGSIVIDFGAGTTEVAVFKGKMLKKARVFPVGSRHIDNDIAIVLGTSPREAERLKLEYGIAYVDETSAGEPVQMEHVGGEKKNQITRGMLCEIIHERVNEIARMVGHDLEADMPISVIPAGIVLTGNGSLLNGFSQVFEKTLGMNVRIGRPNYAGDHADEVSTPGFSTALGILRCTVQAISFSPLAAGGSRSILSDMLRSISRFFRGFFSKTV